MSSATIFDSEFYLSANADVSSAVEAGIFINALEHFTNFGASEFRSPNAIFSFSYYASQNPDVVIATEAGFFDTVFGHYQLFGETENRVPTLEYAGFNAESYLSENPDVKSAVDTFLFNSALQHFLDFGRFESRTGSQIHSNIYNLTDSLDEIMGGFGDDKFFADLSTLNFDDVLNGGGGVDTLEILFESFELQDLSLPNDGNFFNFEVVVLDLENMHRSDNGRSNLDFSGFAGLGLIEIKEGHSADLTNLNLNLGEVQVLNLKNISDTDLGMDFLSNDGLHIDQANISELLELNFDTVNPNESGSQENLNIDLAASELTELKLNIENDIKVGFENSGGKLTKLFIDGTGSIELGSIPRTITFLNANTLAAPIKFDSLGPNLQALTGLGDDVVSVNDGFNVLETQNGSDTIIVLGGSNEVFTGDGDDTVEIYSGTNDLDTGPGADKISIITDNAGLPTSIEIKAGEGNDEIFISDRLNQIEFLLLDGGTGEDIVTVTNSNNFIVPANLNFENFSITNTIHQSLDFSTSGFTDIELNSGSTIDNSSITLNLLAEQKLTLNEITDGDILAASLADGGLIINQADVADVLDLNLIGVGGDLSNPNTNLFIDLAGSGLSNTNLTNQDSSFIVLQNSGGALRSLNIAGSGTLGIMNMLPSSITDISGENSLINLNLTLGTGGAFMNLGAGNHHLTIIAGTNTISTKSGQDTAIIANGNNTVDTGVGNDSISILGGINALNASDGNDNISLSDGTNVVFTGAGQDVITAQGGSHDINSGPGDDIINISASSALNTIDTGSGNDSISITGGENTLSTSDGNDSLTILDGTNVVNNGNGQDIINILAGANEINSGLDSDTITISGGTNTINSGGGDDNITMSAGVNNIDSGSGNDIITASGGSSNVDIRSLDGGEGNDRLDIFSTGNVTLPTASNIENFFISDTVHQSLDFSFSASIDSIELDSGTTIDDAVITLTLGIDQALILDSITDGDSATATLADGGITIAQAASLTSLDLTLDDVGPSTSTANENVFIDIAGTGVTTAKVTSGNDSFVVISNTGGNLAGIELLGAGTIALGTLPSSITNINGAAATANLTLTIGSSGVNTFRGGIGDDAVTLTGGTNDVQTGDGDDIITTSTNLAVGDRIDGGDGTDTLEVIHTGLATIPTTTNLTSIERIAIQDTVHQSLDFSALTSITGIELDSGTTVDNATINTVLGSGQALTLDSITDGDTAAASLADGGIKISQANSITALDLTLDDMGPNSANTNTNLFVDIAGTGVATANITSANDSFIVLENSGAALSVLNLTGSGTLGIQGALPDSVTTINGTNSTANLTVTSGAGDDTIIGGAGNDSITLTGGTNNVTGGNGNDTIILSTGNDTVTTGSGDDNVTAAAGSNNITTGANNDQITIRGGTNTVNTGDNNDVVNSSGGDSNITTESGNDQVTLSGSGTNTVNTGSNNDAVNASAGNNNITTESGSDQVTLSGGTNTVNTGSNGDTINVSGGVNNITTADGGDQVTLTGGTNTVDTGSSADTVTLSTGTDTVDTGSGNDTVEAGGTLTTADTIDGGADTDTIASTVAMTDALAARLSNFEIFDIKGSGGVTHDVSALTGLTSLKVSAALTGAVVVTDLAVGAEVDFSAAIANNLTINQINAAGGGTDTLTFDFSGGTYTTGASIIASNIETVTLKTSAAGTKTVSGATFANAGTLNITAPSANLTISDLTALNLQTFDVSSTGSRTTNITTGADVFSNALTYTGGGGNDTLDLDGATLQNTFTYNGGNGDDALELDGAALQNTFSYNGGSGADSLNLNGAALSGALTFDGGSGDDTLNLDGATLAAGSVFVVGDDQDTLTLNVDAVASVVRTSATTSNNAFSVQDDATTAHTASFTSGSDTFDYNGSVSHDSTTTIVKAAGATLQAAVAADADATVYVIQDADGDADFETELNLFADGVSNSRANTLETEAIDTGLLSYTGLDAAFDSSDIVLLAIDSETNEDATTANNGGTAVYRFRNSDTSTVDTVLSSEIELLGVFQDAALVAADFI